MKKQGKVGTKTVKTKVKKRQTKTTISVCGWDFAVEWGEISTAQAKKIIKSGIHENDLEDLLTHSESGVSEEIEILVNDKVVKYDMPKNRAKVTQVGNPKSWLIVKTEAAKGELRTLVISEQFDPTKLQCEPGRVCIGNKLDVEGFSVSYDGKGLDYGNSDIKCAGCVIYSPQGEEFDFDISDDDMEEEP